MVASAYKYVTWSECIQRFTVQISNFHGRRVYKAFWTEREAVNYLTKLTGKNAELREKKKPQQKPAQQKRKPAPQKRKPAQQQQPLAESPGSAYRYVSWHKGLRRFVVQLEAYKSFAKEEEALKYVMRKTKKRHTCY